MTFNLSVEIYNASAIFLSFTFHIHVPKLSDLEIEVLSHTLHHYVPYKMDVRKLVVEFEQFYKEIFPHTTHLNSCDKIILKSKYVNTFNRYSKIQHINEDQNIGNLSKNKEIIIL